MYVGGCVCWLYVCMCVCVCVCVRVCVIGKSMIHYKINSKTNSFRIALRKCGPTYGMKRLIHSTKHHNENQKTSHHVWNFLGLLSWYKRLPLEHVQST